MSRFAPHIPESYHATICLYAPQIYVSPVYGRHGSQRIKQWYVFGFFSTYFRLDLQFDPVTKFSWPVVTVKIGLPGGSL